MLNDTQRIEREARLNACDSDRRGVYGHSVEPEFAELEPVQDGEYEAAMHSVTTQWEHP